jgi:hypothetical protein
MSPEAVERKFRRLLNLGDCAPWPPVVGHWKVSASPSATVATTTWPVS